jgi:TIR domain
MSAAEALPPKENGTRHWLVRGCLAQRRQVISYAHSESNEYVMERFVDDLTGALSSALSPYNATVYRDKERNKPGFKFDVAIAQALCKSTAMICIFAPKYFERDYCVRELIAMKYVEARRIELLSSNVLSQGMIIPVLFRGEYLQFPENLRPAVQYVDFSRYTPAIRKIYENRKYADKIEEIAKAVYDLRLKFGSVDCCRICDQLSSLESITAPVQTYAAQPSPWVME